MTRSARISACGRYRYELAIVWDEALPRLTVVMCNPSTADAQKDDPTSHAVTRYAKRLGFGGVVIVNLFAYRATDPAELEQVAVASARAAIGPDNEEALAKAMPEAGYILVAWGGVAEQIPGFGAMRRVLEELACGPPNIELRALAETASGAPRHPLARGKHRIPDDAQPQIWPAPDLPDDAPPPYRDIKPANSIQGAGGAGLNMQPAPAPARPRMTLAEWRAQATALFGEDTLAWRFVCPLCGHVASVRDWQAAGAGEGAVAFSCVGRWIEGAGHAFEATKRGPCNYAGGGLFRLNPVTVVGDDGTEHQVFAFAVQATEAVRCGVCAGVTPNRNHEAVGDGLPHEPTCDTCLAAARGEA